MGTTSSVAADGDCVAVVRRDQATLDAVADEWDALWARCPAATPFQTWAWQSSWWRAYGRPGALRLVLVRRAGQLVGVGAFHRRARAGVGVLEPLGGALSDWTDVLVDPDHAAAGLGALRDALLAEPGWQVLDLPEVRAGAAALAWADGWPGPKRRLPGSVCGDMAAVPFDDAVAAMSSSRRQGVRRSLRKVDGAGLVETDVAPGAAPAAVDTLLALHHEQWRARGGMNPEHGRPRFAGLLRRALPTMIEKGQASLTTYTIDGDVAAVNLMLVGPDVVGGYLFGARPELFGRFNVTAMLMRSALRLATERGAGTFSMLRGREAYKSEWNADAVPNTRLLLSRPGHPAGPAFAAAVQARRAAVDRVRTHAPAVRGWVLRARAAVRNPRLLLEKARRR